MTAAVPSGTEAVLPRGTAMFMLCMLGLTYAVNAMDRIVFPILLPNVSKDYGFSLEQGGFLATIFTLGIGLSGIPSGYLLDRFSRLNVILVGIVIYSVLTILSAFSVGFTDMAIYRALSGVGEGMQNAALFTAVGAYFASSRATAVGSLNFAYGAGSFIGPTLAAYILVWTGTWQAPLIAYGLLGLLVLVLARITVRTSFTERSAEPTRAVGLPGQDSMPPGVLNRNTVICALSAVMLGVSGYGFLGLYPTFLRTELGFTVPQAGFAASLFGLGALFGIPAGYVADRISQRAIAIVSTLVMLTASYPPVQRRTLATRAGRVGLPLRRRRQRRSVRQYLRAHPTLCPPAPHRSCLRYDGYLPLPSCQCRRIPVRSAAHPLRLGRCCLAAALPRAASPDDRHALP